MWNNAYGAFSTLRGLSQSQRGNRKRASIQNGGKEQWWFIASKAKLKAERLFWQGLEGNLSVQKITSKLCLLWCASIRGGSKGIITELCSMFCSVWIWVAVVFSSQRECLWTYLAIFFPSYPATTQCKHYFPCLNLYKHAREEFDQDVSSQPWHRTK